MELNALKHQSALIDLIRTRPELPYVALIGGFGAGKSFTDVLLLTYLTQVYRHTKEPITFGIFGVTIKLLSQTVIADFERYLDAAGISYRDNSQKGRIEIGNLSFVYLQMQNPGDIYAHNFHGALIDELDEVPPEKVLKIVEAIQERCRKMIPAVGTMPARGPFMVFTTTAQGLGGTYLFFEKLKKQNKAARAQGLPPPVPFAIVHARTIDNPHLDPKQVERLRALYTPEEAQAYLEGKFINLATGRVWHSFDRRKHVCMRFDIKPMEHIYVGQDFNTGFNANCIGIERNGHIYLIDSRHNKDMGEAADTLRLLYPTNPMTMIPDASGKEIMSGFVNKYEEKNIDIYWNNQNPSITERVMVVNMLFRQGRIHVFEDNGTPGSLQDKAILALETHDFDEKTGKPRKGTGQEAPDHYSDSMSYMVWRIIHGVKGFEEFLAVLQSVHKRDGDL